MLRRSTSTLSLHSSDFLLHPVSLTPLSYLVVVTIITRHLNVIPLPPLLFIVNGKGLSPIYPIEESGSGLLRSSQYCLFR